MRGCRSAVLALLGGLALAPGAAAQAPGDESIALHLGAQARALEGAFLEDVTTAAEWHARRPRYHRELLHMLGLWPLPERTPLQVQVTGALSREGYVVEKLHFQSRPGLYVTANFYRPEGAATDRRPAVLYLAGHASRGRDGNKTAYQSHGIWFARHGYVCLMLDTLQLGEIAALHHGTYREERWWWHSRGYTPAGVETWNGIRAIDYLQSRADVDPDRIAVTGISGGGATAFWVAAADERVAVAAPVSGMADLPAYVGDRVVDEHCDCMFLYNTFEWPWTRIAALVAPRPLLFVNSHRDALFPMDANERIAARLERLYALFGAGHLVDSVVSLGGHAYREDIRRAVYRFLGTHLVGDGRPVTDSEADLVTGEEGESRHPIPPAELRVFPTDADLPGDERNTSIDERFVSMAVVAPPEPGGFPEWKAALLAELERVTFRDRPWTPAAALEDGPDPDGWLRLESEEGVRVYLEPHPPLLEEETLLVVAPTGSPAEIAPGAWLLHPRGTGPTRWSRRNPPNTVERSYPLLVRTADAGRVRDIASAARALGERGARVHVRGEGAAGVLAAYAALWTPEIAEVTAVRPPASHMSAGAPQLLNVLRVCDVAEAFGMLAPRPLTLVDAPPELRARVRAIYAAAGAPGSLTLRDTP